MAHYKLSEIVDGVKGIILESLDIDGTPFELSTSLVEELGAESLDFIDMTFRLEKKYSISLERNRLEKDLELAFPTMTIKSNTLLTPEIAATLKQRLPEIAPEDIDALKKLRDLPNAFTVATFVRMTVHGILADDPSSVVEPDVDVGMPPEKLGLAP